MRRVLSLYLSIMGQAITSTQFYLMGRNHFTQTGYLRHVQNYSSPDPLPSGTLQGKAFVVTGANSGIGKEITRFLADKGGRVYMVCRNEERANAARDDVATDDACRNRLVPIIGDCSLRTDVHRIAAEISEREPSGIDGLVCNAGVLLNEYTETAEGVETTFACHLAFGSYLLSKTLLPSIRQRAGRVCYVSSGGMYNSKFPAWDVATCKDPSAYDGQFAYVFAKRGQVLLAEHLAAREAGNAAQEHVTYVSAHPGWTATPAVSAAYGDQAKYLQPMRDLWQGAEGICWLMVADREELAPGEFYLDRQPQPKHVSGPFFTEGSRTKNTPAEVTAMVERLEEICGSA